MASSTGLKTRTTFHSRINNTTWNPCWIAFISFESPHTNGSSTDLKLGTTYHEPQYHVKSLLNRLHLNSHTLGNGLQKSSSYTDLLLIRFFYRSRVRNNKGLHLWLLECTKHVLYGAKRHWKIWIPSSQQSDRANSEGSVWRNQSHDSEYEIEWLIRQCHYFVYCDFKHLKMSNKHTCSFWNFYLSSYHKGYSK